MDAPRRTDFSVAALRPEDESMDRRAFITNALLSAGFLAATAGAASALPSLPSHDTLAPASNVENAWWYRRRYWHRRYWRRCYWTRWGRRCW